MSTNKKKNCTKKVYRLRMPVIQTDSTNCHKSGQLDNLISYTITYWISTLTNLMMAMLYSKNAKIQIYYYIIYYLGQAQNITMEAVRVEDLPVNV